MRLIDRHISILLHNYISPKVEGIYIYSNYNSAFNALRLGVITPSFDLHHVEVVDQDPPSDRL